jgi:hypothetical protein
MKDLLSVVCYLFSVICYLSVVSLYFRIPTASDGKFVPLRRHSRSKLSAQRTHVSEGRRRTFLKRLPIHHRAPLVQKNTTRYHQVLYQVPGTVRSAYCVRALELGTSKSVQLYQYRQYQLRVPDRKSPFSLPTTAPAPA